VSDNQKILLVDPEIYTGDCLTWLEVYSGKKFDLSFVDPPFNQGKYYRYFNDKQPSQLYWKWITEILHLIYRNTSQGGGTYFMQREKNTKEVLKSLEEVGWEYQNLLIWKKKTSAIPCDIRFAKQHQIIVFATKGKRPRVFNKLRINPPLPQEYKQNRNNGLYLTDVWDDIRELTSGYYAGDEAIRDIKGNRKHTQQSPIALLLRIILSSTKIGDLVFDPFSGTGTTLVVAKQLERNSIGIEIDPDYKELINQRLELIRESDNVGKYFKDYIHTDNLENIWMREKWVQNIN
jgi:DNA modification methylase